MLEDLKIKPAYDGFLYLAEAARNLPRLRSHRHVELELNLVVRGSITYVVNDRRLTFGKGMALWFFPEQEHQLVDLSFDAQYFVAVFKPSLIARSCSTPLYDGLKCEKNKADGVVNTWLEPSSFALVRQVMESVMQGSLDADLLNREAGFGAGSSFSFDHHDPDGLNAGLHHLLLLCWRSQKTGKVFGDAVVLHPAVRRVLHLMSESSEEYDLTELAALCGVSESYLSRTFARQIGVPVSRYRNSLRLSRFWEEQRCHPGKTLAETVYTAGFGSYAQFYKVFVQEYGRGPRLRRAQHPFRHTTSRLTPVDVPTRLCGDRDSNPAQLPGHPRNAKPAVRNTQQTTAL